MKATGITRRVDDLGRIVIPRDIRQTMGIRVGDPLEIFVDEDKNLVCFQKYDVEKNYLEELKNISDSIADLYGTPETLNNVKIINKAIHEIELQLKAITEREE